MNQQRNVDPLYAGPRQGAQPGGHTRNTSVNQSNGQPVDDGESIQNRAARFEDEKKRIIESCFSKKDTDGVVLESYITHIRVIEDAAYPSSPPPPDSLPSNKKQRVILVAVRRSGKVRIHKARQNPSGTFSIGKTWNMEDLNAIQSYLSYTPTNQQELYERQWAGSTGFAVTLGKPYYWQASTSKEKDFFIASLVKIYRKYTGGKLPELIGFSGTDMEVYAGTPSGQPTPVLRGQNSPVAKPAPSPTPPVSAPPPAAATSTARLQSPYNAGIYGRVTSPTESEERLQNRSDLRPTTRDEQRRPSQDSARSHGRSPSQQMSKDDRRSPFSGEKPSQTDRFPPKPYLQPQLQQSSLHPSVSSKSSQSSLRSAEKRADAMTARSNGVSTPATTSYEASTKNLSTAKSIDTLPSTSETETVASSRPSTDTTESRPSETKQSKPQNDDDLIPAKLRPGPLKLGLTKRTSYHSQTTSQQQTPIASPSLSKVDQMNAGILESSVSGRSEETSKPESTGFGIESIGSEPVVAEPEPISPTQGKPRSRLFSSGTLTPPVNVPAPTAEHEETHQDRKTGEEFRPGLGPMLKKKSGKEIANQFRKAALAASAFQPRQGGAGARLKAMQEKQTNEPDGITGVVPAPLFRGMSSDSATTPTQEMMSPVVDKERPLTPVTNNIQPKVQLQRTATDDIVKPQTSTPFAAEDLTTEVEKPEIRPPSPEKPRSRSPQRKRRQRHEAEIEKYCSVLGLDPRIIEGRGADFNELLTEFGWDGKLVDKQKIENFEAEIRREIGRAQATGWLGHIDQQENKVQDLAKAFDKAIAECEELDGLLTLYSHELDTLHDDIEYIEAQSQGLQVQTANQKLLHAELQSLLKTLTIPSTDLRALRGASFDTTDGVQAVEKSLALLFRAMITIDPEIRQNRIRQQAAATGDRNGLGVYADTEIGQIRAVRQKKDEYREETLSFLRRFNQHMTSIFKLAEQRTSEENSRSAASSNTSLSLRALQTSRQEMWMYNAMMLFVREVNSYEWQTLITSYEINIKSSYQEQFRDNVTVQRQTARKPGPEDAEALFTNQEKEKGEESLTSTAARKLTVRRGKPVKTGGFRRSISDRREGKPEAWEVFETVLSQQSKIIAEEQNFIVSFFHLNSQSNTDFVDIITSKPPDRRALPNLWTKQSYDPDRNLAKIVQQVTDGIFSFWATDMQALVEWVLQMDFLQAVGVLLVIEQCLAEYEETNQEYITRTLRSLHERLTGLFHKFVEEQLKAIEETRVKVKKRKGIISFMRTLPMFVLALENQMPSDNSRHESLEVRFIINDAYIKILKAMWESLNFIARDNPVNGSGGMQTNPSASGDPEDKEVLNYHILLIENMNYFVEEIDTRHNVVLLEWVDKANHDLGQHMSAYIDAVIRRPLGKWLDFLEGTEALMKNTDSYGGIADKPSHSRSSAKKLLAAYDSKEMRKGIDTLKKRIEKHFAEVDELNTSRGLVMRVFEECSVRYQNSHDRMRAIIEQVYESGLEIDWRKEEVAALFKR